MPIISEGISFAVGQELLWPREEMRYRRLNDIEVKINE